MQNRNGGDGNKIRNILITVFLAALMAVVVWGAAAIMNRPVSPSVGGNQSVSVSETNVADAEEGEWELSGPEYAGVAEDETAGDEAEREGEAVGDGAAEDRAEREDEAAGDGAEPTQEEQTAQEAQTGQEEQTTQEPQAGQEEQTGQEPQTGQEEQTTQEPQTGQEEQTTQEVQEPEEAPAEDAKSDSVEVVYHFRNEEALNQHFEKHGAEFDYATAQEYEAGANRVIMSSEALHKKEAEDGDDVYYLEATNEFVVVSPRGVIRTYFKPDAGIAYYERQ